MTNKLEELKKEMEEADAVANAARDVARAALDAAAIDGRTVCVALNARDALAVARDAALDAYNNELNNYEK